jgi:hypothetical protein
MAGLRVSLRAPPDSEGFPALIEGRLASNYAWQPQPAYVYGNASFL